MQHSLKQLLTLYKKFTTEPELKIRLIQLDYYGDSCKDFGPIANATLEMAFFARR